MHPGLVIFLTLLAIGTVSYWIYNNFFTRDAMKGRINKKHRNMLDEYKKMVMAGGRYTESLREDCDFSEEKLNKLYRQATFLGQMVYFGNHIRGPKYGMFKIVKEDMSEDPMPAHYYTSHHTTMMFRAQYWYRRVLAHLKMDYADKIKDEDELKKKIIRQCKIRYIRALTLLLENPKMSFDKYIEIVEDHEKFRFEPDMFGHWGAEQLWDPETDTDPGVYNGRQIGNIKAPPSAL